jgi:hypothetical protein
MAAKKKSESDAILEELHAFGMKYPGAHTKAPWPGHNDLAVNDKTFVYFSTPGEPLGVGCKLPQSAEMALLLPYCTPMAYGLGKSGWVSAKPPPGEIDVEMFKAWIDESYRAQAPKKFLKQLDAGAAPMSVRSPAKKAPAKKAPAKKKPAKKK